MGTVRKAPPLPDWWEKERESQKTYLHPETKAYRVVAPRAVSGIEPGEIGDLTLTADQAETLIEAGFIVPVDAAEEQGVAVEQPEQDVAEPVEVQPEPGHSPKKKVKE